MATTRSQPSIHHYWTCVSRQIRRTGPSPHQAITGARGLISYRFLFYFFFLLSWFHSFLLLVVSPFRCCWWLPSLSLSIRVSFSLTAWVKGQKKVLTLLHTTISIRRRPWGPVAACYSASVLSLFFLAGIGKKKAQENDRNTKSVKMKRLQPRRWIISKRIQGPVISMPQVQAGEKKRAST